MKEINTELVSCAADGMFDSIKSHIISLLFTQENIKFEKYFIKFYFKKDGVKVVIVVNHKLIQALFSKDILKFLPYEGNFKTPMHSYIMDGAYQHCIGYEVMEFPLPDVLCAKAISNLGYSQPMDLEIKANGLRSVDIKINTFATTAKLVEVSGQENDILIYRYHSKNSPGKFDHLHLRFAEKKIYGQFVQDGLAPGGSCFVYE